MFQFNNLKSSYTTDFYTTPIMHSNGVDMNTALLMIIFMTVFGGSLSYMFIQELISQRNRKYGNLYNKKDMTNMPQELGARMKFYENYTENCVSHIPSTHCFAVVLDGRGFKSILRELVESIKNTISTCTVPYSSEVKYAFERTTSDLMHEFHATTGYTYGDKIILLFSVHKSTQNTQHIFGGRISKLQSVISSYAVSRFIANLTHSNFNNNPYISNLTSFEESKLSFVSRVVVFPHFNCNEMVNYIDWHQNNAYNSFISHMRRHHCSVFSNMCVSLSSGMFIKRLDDMNNYRNSKYAKFVIPDIKVNDTVYEFLADKSFQEWEYSLVLDTESCNYQIYDINSLVSLSNPINEETSNSNIDSESINEQEVYNDNVVDDTDDVNNVD